MVRLMGVLGAGALLLATAGCTLDSFFLSFGGSSNRKEQVVAGEVTQVAASLQSNLTNFGLRVAESRSGEEIRLSGMTAAGKKFTFILQRQKSDGGERTLIGFEGEKEVEDQVWVTALAVLAGPPRSQQPWNNFPDANP